MAVELANLYLAIKTLEGVKWFMGLLGVKGFGSALGGKSAALAFLATPLGLIITAALGLATVRSILGVDGEEKITAAPEKKTPPIPPSLQSKPTVPTTKPITSPVYGTILTPSGPQLVQSTMTKPSTNLNKPTISMYANGGMVNQGQLFVAGEMGPELIGTMGGQTAVANQNQIIEGIKQGVMEAMAENQGGDIVVKLQIGSTEFEQLVSRSLRDYNRRTGVSFA